MKYKSLFEPFKIGKTYFKNRIFSAPMGYMSISPNATVTDDLIAYYERKAQGGAAVITLGEGSIDSEQSKLFTHMLDLESPGARSGLSRLADTVSRHGAVLSIELEHHGRPFATTLPSGEKVVYGPSECELEGMHVREMPEERIMELIEKYAKAAHFVKQCGFGMVMVHAGHGWLQNQFLAPRINMRKDKWGGSIENRTRFLREIINAIHKLCGDDFPVEVRISATELTEHGYGIDEGIEIAKQLDGIADIIHVSAGCEGFTEKAYAHEVFTTTHPSMFLEDGVNVRYAAEVKKHVHKSKIATLGALSDPAMMEEIISSGKADIVEMARGLNCDPDIPNKALDDRGDEIIHCMRCLYCFSIGMRRGYFFCVLNPEIERGRYLGRVLPDAKKQKVLVVGGGIGGMQAALVSARHGHEVILCEKGPRLGGNMLCEESVPFKRHLKEYVELQRRLVDRAHIDIRLNTEVTPEYAKSMDADVIIAALGARPIVPEIPGIDSPQVIGAEYAFSHTEAVGDKSVILGAGLVGTELAIYLAMLGKKATIIEIEGEINTGVNYMHGYAIKVQLAKHGIDIHFNAKTSRIGDDEVCYETQDGETSLKCDTVIYAVGRTPLHEEACALRDCARRFYAIGDCVTPRTIAAANEEAATIARDIGRF